MIQNWRRNIDKAGPTTNHIQNKAHINHKLAALSFLFADISDKIELITEIFHQVIQFITLQTIKNKYVLDKVIIKFEKKLQITHKIKTFFLQILSDNWPKIGLKINEKKA